MALKQKPLSKDCEVNPLIFLNRRFKSHYTKIGTQARTLIWKHMWTQLLN